MHLIDARDGLVLGVCNGFQALIKLGLVPYGRIVEPSAELPTLTFNMIGRHHRARTHACHLRPLAVADACGRGQYLFDAGFAWRRTLSV